MGSPSSKKSPTFIEAGYRGAGVRVAVVDTGFLLDHPVFRGPDGTIDVVAQWDFVDHDSEEVRTALFESGDYFLEDGSYDPRFILGYGIPDLARAAGLGVRHLNPRAVGK